MALIGRKQELEILETCANSQRPEFLAVYGRRRVGKTFLVREYFKNSFSFYATGISEKATREQLRAFNNSLREYGNEERAIPSDWFDAFRRLRELLSKDDIKRDAASGRIVVFLDELPWFDTPRSHFKAALDQFWNGWASTRSDVMLVVCGSATSWMLTNLIYDTGGFYNRITRQIHLQPFTLKECEEYFLANNIPFTRQQIIESYMVFGGIPYYLNLIDRRLSLAQNIQILCFAEEGQLHNEFGILFKSLFKRSEKHERIITELAKRNCGVLRVELAAIKTIGDGRPLTKTLDELEQCGFIRKYHNYGKNKSGNYFQLTDPFTLFASKFLNEHDFTSWETYLGTPGYHSWTGSAFELVCLLHVRQMKRTLGIEGVLSNESAWRSKQTNPGAQIDLIIDRKDGVINVCEMKYSSDTYAIDAAEERNLRNKLDVFSRETKTKKALHLTMVTMHGIAQNTHSGIVVREITSDDLFS